VIKKGQLRRWCNPRDGGTFVTIGCRIHRGGDRRGISTMLKVCDEDLAEEEARLRCALLDVKTSRSNIRSLKKKRERILERKAEMEGK